MNEDKQTKTIPWHQSFAWYHVLILAQASLLINVFILLSDPSSEGIGILTWIWLIGTVYGAILFFKRKKK